jgi:hypothetical protein
MTTTPPVPPRQISEVERLRRLRARLKRASESLTRLEVRLQALHADRTGSARLYYSTVPLIPDESKGVEQSIRRIQAEASEGCPLAADWLLATLEQREGIDALRRTPLPKEDPACTGRWLSPKQAKQLGRPRRVVVPLRESGAAVSDYFAECLQLQEEREAARRAARLSLKLFAAGDQVDDPATTQRRQSDCEAVGLPCSNDEACVFCGEKGFGSGIEAH